MERDSSTVKEGGFQGEGRQAKRSSPPRRSRRKYKRATGRKSSIWRVLVSLQVWPNLKWNRKLGDEGLVYKKTGRSDS